MGGSVDKSRDWINPTVGERIQVGLTEKLDFKVRGDIGGFDLGDSIVNYEHTDFDYTLITDGKSLNDEDVIIAQSQF
jgi:hypothetical protein